ncbi:37S ribosomal protein S16, mitochondrial [Savitreella phatthalungensis]
MVLRIRLQRQGQKKLPIYSIVCANARTGRNTQPIERLGTYNPIPTREGIKHIEINPERVHYWIGVGAQPSETAARVLEKADLWVRPPKPERQKHHIFNDLRVDLAACTPPTSPLQQALAATGLPAARRVGPRRGTKTIRAGTPSAPSKASA